MALAVTLTPRAAADIAAIRDHLLARSPDGAESVRLAINRTLALLEQFPGAGRARPEYDARSISVTGYAYTIYYRLEPDEVVIVHVRDDRRRPLATGEI